MKTTPCTSSAGGTAPTFTTLPPEIRNLIYEQLLVRTAPIPPWPSGPGSSRSYGIFDLFFPERWGHLVPTTSLPASQSIPSGRDQGAAQPDDDADLRAQRPAASQKLHTSILRVSKAIYAEALPVLYAQNCFIVEVRDGGFEWPGDYVREEHLSRIEHLFASVFLHADAHHASGSARAFAHQGSRAVTEICTRCQGVRSVDVEVVRLGLDQYDGWDHSLTDYELGSMVDDGEDGERFEIKDKWVRRVLRPWVSGLWSKGTVSGDVSDEVAKELEAANVEGFQGRKSH